MSLKTTETVEIYTCNMLFQRNVTLLLGRIELVDVKLDAIAELDATEYAEVTGTELVCSTDLGSGRGRRMESGCDGRRKSGQGKAPASRIHPARAGVQSASGQAT
jgi:hypothetical protein